MENESMMYHRTMLTFVAVLALGLSVVQAQEPVAPSPTTDETGSMPGMDHSHMNHGTTPAADPAAKPDATEHAGHDMGSMTHDHSASPGMQGGVAPVDARDPHAHSDGYGFGPIPPPHMGDRRSFSALLVDQLEGVWTRDNSSAAYDLHAWYGRTFDRAVLKSEGEVDGGVMQDARTELLWGHAVTAYWDTQLGVRYDSGARPDRGWLAFGVEGLAPYWFDVEATAYVGDQGRSALRVAAAYELLFTQRLVLQPRVEASFYGKRDAERALGAGLSELVAGLRLRYEIRREFAPYVGVEWAGKFGATADDARRAGADAGETRVVAGVRFWY
jgi:copper resistance protein B